ncbi:MAG: hypothetical protein LBD58_08345 [Treponema sp.]|jgi:hypothetical protein|nr:hypothetical protein [Treponema sp.]
MNERLIVKKFLCLENIDFEASWRKGMKTIESNPKGVGKELKRIAQDAGNNDRSGRRAAGGSTAAA